MDPIGGRFAIERDAGAGGMARVYRARDLTTDGVVALKLLTRMEEADLKRFTREVAALSELRDAAIPQYIAHGFTPAGEPWIAMEWLDGETLDGYLTRGPLRLDQALALGRAVAGALATAHARGIIHRDVKPGNVFLAGADPSRAKLIDFGIARDTLATLGVTRGGDLLGTPLYMAPEQARGELDLDARVDVYALGALLFTCLTGKPPFLASTLVALLAKIVIEDAPSLAANAPDVPPALDALVARMLAKHRDERPPNAAVVALELDALRGGLPVVARPAALSARNELRVVSVLLASGVDRSVAPDVTLDATIDARGSGTLALADGSSIVTFTGPETPGDLAARAIRYALGIASPGAAIALATGRAVMTTGTPMGEVIERAGKQLAFATGEVRIDDDTAGLVEGRFELARDSYGAKVLGETTGHDPLRTLLGKPTRCVGRDRELAAVEGHYAEVVSESIARAVLVFAEPGIGKSRFGREVVRRLASRDDAPSVTIVRGEPNTATSALSSIASAVRREIGAPQEGAVASGGAPVDEFLAELAGIPVAAPSDQLRAARESPLLMFEQLRAAWTRWLAAAAKQRAQLIVVEDLQWVDAQSLLLLDAALEALADQPLFVFAVGRPEARRAAPFATRKPHELRLDPLPKRASERLVREALGEVADSVVGAIVERAGGNALFLEELVRAFSESVTSLPVGVIGTVQLRLDGLRPEARAALRAASVFGERFRADGVEALLARSDIGGALDELVVHELISRSDDGFAFRHALVREAAYALLTDEDRLLAHRLAAEQLERTGEHAPGEIAHHYQLARCGEQAADWFVRAGEHALLHNDLAGAVTHARRALAWAEQTIVRGRAQHVIAESEMWRANLDDARTAAQHAVDNLPAGALAWFEAAAFQITIAGQLGDNDTVASWVDRVAALAPDDESLSAYANCLARAASQLYLADRGDVALRAHARLEAEIGGRTLTPYAQARVEIARGYAELYRGAMDVCTDALANTIAIYERVGARREALQTRAQRGSILGFAGSFEQARVELQRVLDEAAQLDASYTAQWARWQLALIAATIGDVAAARSIMENVGPRVVAQPLFLGGTAVVLGWRALADNDLATVDFWIERARGVAIAERYVITLSIFDARVRQLRGDASDVESIARRGLDYIDRHEGMRCDVHLAGISVALEILGNPHDLVARQQARINETAALFGRPENAEMFIALPWLSAILSRQPS